MFDIPAILADGDWLRFLIPLVAFLIWLASNVIRGAQPKGRQPPLPRQQQRSQPPQPGQPNADQVTAEIQKFLRRAAGHRDEEQADEVEILEPVASQQLSDPFTAIPPSGPSGVARGSSVAEHVAQHIDTSTIREHVSHLGEHIDQADERLARRLHQVFDHDLGQLRDTSLATQQAESALKSVSAESTASGVPPTTAASVAEAFRNPQSIRQAIILSEIINRREMQ